VPITVEAVQLPDPRSDDRRGPLVGESEQGDLADRHWWLAATVKALHEHLYFGILRGDGSYEELFAGPGLDRLFGGPVDPDAPDAWRAAIEADDLPGYRACEADLLAGRPSEVSYRVRGLDGVTRWVHARVHPQALEPGAVHFAGILSDVTEQRRASDELHRALAELGSLNAQLADAHRTAERLASTDALTGLASRRSFGALLGDTVAAPAARCGLLILDVDHFKRINDTYGHRAGDDVLVAIAQRARATLAASATLARWGGEELVALLPGCATSTELREAAEAMRRAVKDAPIPMRDDGLLTVTVSCGGALYAGGSADEMIDAADAALYRAKQAGRDRSVLASDPVGVAGSDTLELVRIARCLARAASIREGGSDVHCNEVAELSAALADALVLPAATVLRCRIAGLLHDVGKIAIPDRVLGKPGPLDDEEWLTMRTHASVGAELIRNTPGLEDAAPGVRHHHERFDGTGYPDGLAGAAIPIEARIVAVADTWSAMTHDRVYLAARSYESALEELGRCAGTQLDPEIVRLLQDLLRLRRAAANRAAHEAATPRAA
jgi:diguanylate cyclase (GGDEF)-like protein/putative nucleotidyltransferase with HDIG domain